MRIFRFPVIVSTLFCLHLGAQPLWAAEPETVSLDQQVAKYIQDFPYQETHKYLKMYKKNVATFGPATTISTFDTYEITADGREIVEKLGLR